MDESREIITRRRGFLNKCREDITFIMENPVLSDWSRINIHEFNDILDSLDVPPNLMHAQSQYFTEARKALLQTEAMENEIGSLEADLKLKLVPPEKLLQESRRTEGHCRELEKTMTTLGCYVDIIKEVDRAIRELLVLDRFFPVARRLSDNPEGFDSGVRVFRSLSMDKDEKSLNVYDLFASANRLEARLDKIDFSLLPAVVISVLKNRMDACFEATREIKNFLDHTASFVGKELNTIRAIGERLNGYAQDPVSLLLKSLKREAAATAKALSELRRYGYVLQELVFINLVLQDASAICTGMKQEVTGKLRESINAPGSPLAPSRTAALLAHEFFGGLRGFLRMVRMLFLSFTGRPILSEKALQQHIENAIHNAPVCKAGSEADQGRFTAFLEEIVGGLTKPFPHDEVQSVLRNAVDEFVLVVGRFVDNCEITVELEAPPDSAGGWAAEEERGPYTMKTTIGNLVRKVSIRTENLKNHQLMDTE